MVTIRALSAIVRLPNLILAVHSIHARISKASALAHLTLQRRALALSARLPDLAIFVGSYYRIVAICLYALEALLTVDALSRVSKVYLDASGPVVSHLLRDSVRLDVVWFVQGALAAKLTRGRSVDRGGINRRFELLLAGGVTALGVVGNGLFRVRVVVILLLARCLVENVVVHVHVQISVEVASLLAQHRDVVDL